MQTIPINFIVPQGWHELSDKQLRYVYQLLANEFATDKVKTFCLLQWSGTKVIGRQDSGAYLLKKGKFLFEVTLLTLAELLPHLDWLGSIPTVPVRISKINRQHALPADFSEVPFETFIICDNLYQGYLQTQNDELSCQRGQSGACSGYAECSRQCDAVELLDQLGATLYGKSMIFKPYERINIFYWFAALKDTFSRKFPDFFQPVDAATGGILLGLSAASVEDAMNAQIRALTKGDVTKEGEVLALDTHRALTELNAQTREYKELNAKTASK